MAAGARPPANSPPAAVPPPVPPPASPPVAPVPPPTVLPPSQIPAPEAPAPRRSRFAEFGVRIAVVIVALAIVVLFATRWDRWVGSSARQVTDDAYIRGDITPLSAQVDGYVRHVAVDDFQYVKAGDLLVEIDDADYRARVAQAEADLAAAQAAIDNIKARKAAQHAVVAEAEAAITAIQADSPAPSSKRTGSAPCLLPPSRRSKGRAG